MAAAIEPFPLLFKQQMCVGRGKKALTVVCDQSPSTSTQRCPQDQARTSIRPRLCNAAVTMAYDKTCKTLSEILQTYGTTNVATSREDVMGYFTTYCMQTPDEKAEVANDEDFAVMSPISVGSSSLREGPDYAMKTGPTV